MRKFLGIVFGPNGSGKGTLARNISESLDYFHFDNGKNLRKFARERNRDEILKLIENGEFVDDDFVSDAIHAEFEEINHHKKILLDGIPRKLSQVNIIQEFCKKYNYNLDWIIVLHAPIEILLERLKERVVAPDGKDYHMTLNPPPKHYKLSELKPRPDDRPDIVKRRYEDYELKTLECISDRFFINSKIHTIDATKSIHDVFEESIKFVKSVEDEK